MKIKRPSGFQLPKHLAGAVERRQQMSVAELWPASEPKGSKPPYFLPGGNPLSQVLTLLPVPETTELLAERHNEFFADMIREDTGLDLRRTFLAPCARWGVKALKPNTAEVLGWVHDCVNRKQFRFIISVGDDATKWIINGGKKVPVAYSGQVLYPPKLNHVPLFIFPNTNALVPDLLVGPDSVVGRENYFREQYSRAQRIKVRQMGRNLVKHLTALKLVKVSDIVQH